jgi:hypothetical protein|tara:strand:+ start:190 stop:708 length:519 start_codon:yes stop_codon:yes gene_type:complete
MAFDVNSFKGELKLGGARPNLFQAELISPVGGLDNFRFMCKAAQLPGSTIPSIDVPYFGRQIKYAGNRTFEPWTVTVLNDEDFQVRNSFERWMNAINGHTTNLASLGAASYKTQGSVKHFGKDGSTIARYDFIGIFPTELGAVELAWDTNDVVEEFTVTLAMDYWTHSSVVA